MMDEHDKNNRKFAQDEIVGKKKKTEISPVNVYIRFKKI